MTIETCIDSLVSYAMNNGLAEPVDHMVLTNRLLDLLRKEHGFFAQRLLTFEYEGESGAKTMANIMANLRKPLSVVANIPYYITTPILMKLIESKLPFDSNNSI